MDLGLRLSNTYPLVTMFASAYNGLCFGILFMFNEGFSFVLLLAYY